MDETEHFQELPKFSGLPEPSDMARWRTSVTKGQGDSNFELVGLEEGVNGNMVGIFRRKRKAIVPD